MTMCIRFLQFVTGITIHRELTLVNLVNINFSSKYNDITVFISKFQYDKVKLSLLLEDPLKIIRNSFILCEKRI